MDWSLRNRLRNLSPRLARVLEPPGPPVDLLTATDDGRGAYRRASIERLEYFRAVFDGSRDAILVIDPEHARIIDANAAACRLLAYPRPELLQLDASDLHPHEVNRVQGFFRQVLASGGARSDQLSCRTKDGERLPVEVTAARLTMRGRTMILVTARDIVERKRLEAERREIREQLRLVAEAAPFPLLMTRLSDSVVLFANHWVGPALGLPAEGLVGRRIDGIYLSPEDREDLIAAINRHGHVRNYEVRIRRADGRIISTLHSIQKITFQGEEALLGAFYDVTERVRAEEERRRAEERLRDAIESIADGLVLFDANDRVVIWNRRFADLYPELEPLLPHRPTAHDMFLARYHAGAVGDFDIPAEEYVAWRMEMRQKQGGTPAVHRHSDGRWFRTTERPTREGGIVAISTEITELKEAQTRLVDAIESIGEGFAYFDADGRLVFCNENYRSHWPAARDEIVPGISLPELAGLAWDHGYVHGATVDKQTWLKRRMEQHARLETVLRQTGPQTWIRMSERPIREGGFVQIVIDVSESVKHEAELRAARDEAEFASRAKTEFLANVSHELRTPLNAVIGFSEVMASRMFGPLGDPRYDDYVRDINESGTHLLALINDILDVSKIEAGKWELDEQPADVKETVNACLRIVKERATEGDVRIVDDVGLDLPQLFADPRALKQILINLLSNAIKFTPPGGTVTVRAGVAADGSFALSVVDTGIGMAPADIATALTPFAQVEQSLSRKHDGTGLGLPMVKSLVELHGGALEIDSRPGLGTTVHARFPATRVLDERASRQKAAGAV